jgi:hypothetical protein
LPGFVFLAAAFVAAPAQDAPRSLEVTLKLTTPGISPAGFVTARPSAHRLSVRGLRVATEPPHPERFVELSEDRLVVSASGRDGRELGRITIVDPRLLRAEIADDEGRLSSVRLYRPEADFTIALPDVPAIASLRLFQPVWDGAAFVLELVGEVALGDGR